MMIEEGGGLMEVIKLKFECLSTKIKLNLTI